MDKRIIKIDESKCDGCGLCASVCHEGAIGLVDGKARLLHADYCDGLGDCLPACPRGAISFEGPHRQWPLQIQLVPVKAAFFENAHLLVAADCAAYACSGFHRVYMKDRVTVIGCPKLDPVDYSGKLTEILKANSIKSVTVARMEVPCCRGLEVAVINALKNCGRQIPWQTVTFSTEGKLLQD